MRMLALFCAAISLIMGCDGSTPAGGSGQTGSNKITLQLNWKPEPQFGGFYAAELAREYDNNHLVVQIVPGGAGAPTVDMIASGQTPFGIVSADQLIVARARGKKIVAIFAVYQTHPQGIMTHASRGFAEIGDVFKQEGTLAIQQGLPYVDYLKAKFGFEKLKIVPSPAGDLSVFRSDSNYSMQCFVTSEPLAAKQAGLEAKTFLIADAGFNPYATVLATSDEYLKANRDKVESMASAVKAGWDIYLNDPAQTNAEMAKLNPTMNAETFARSAEAQKPLIVGESDASKVGAMTKERWETLGQQLVELKVIDKAPSAEECFVSDLRIFR